uniref:Uncharacterized protein n=1 Tax=Aegilops tauschii subsp. strangulata TaxID=200361 RepID=A0A452XFW0_AEGTS
ARGPNNRRPELSRHRPSPRIGTKSKLRVPPAKPRNAVLADGCSSIHGPIDQDSRGLMMPRFLFLFQFFCSS